MHLNAGKYVAANKWWDNTNWTDSDGFIVDTTPPTIVINLPSIQSSPTFTVSWSGNDQLNGINGGVHSGISYYYVQVKIGNGQWQTLLSHTTSTSYTYNGNNGQTYYFRARAADKAGNIGSYSTPVQTTVQATGASISVSASPTNLSFSTGETDKNITLTVTATGPGSININQIDESKVNPETGTENFLPQQVNQTVASETSINLTKEVHLSDTQRATILATSSKSFNLSLTIEGNDSYGNPVSSSIITPVQVTELPPPSLVINDVTITLP